jgi:hypothetical protein
VIIGDLMGGLLAVERLASKEFRRAGREPDHVADNPLNND